LLRRLGYSGKIVLTLNFAGLYIFLTGTIHLQASLNLSSSDLLVNLVPVTNRIKVYQTEVKWISSFTGKLNFEIGGTGSTFIINQKSDGANLRSDIQQAVFLFKSIYQPNSKTHTGIKIKSLYYENTQSRAGQFFAERTLSKSISLQIQWHNMFFANQLRFQYNTPNSKGFSLFRMVPSYLLGKVIWYL